MRSSREADRQIWWDRDPADGKKEDSEKIRRKKNVFPFSFGIFPIKFSCLLFFLPYFWPSFDAAINWIQFFRHSLYVSGKDKKQKNIWNLRAFWRWAKLCGRYKRVSFICCWILLIYFLPLSVAPLSITSQIDSSGSRGAGNTRRELAASGRNAFLTGWVGDGFKSRQWRRLVNGQTGYL